MDIKIGDRVRWTTSRKPLGKVVHIFSHRGLRFVVVEAPDTQALTVVRIYEKLIVD